MVTVSRSSLVWRNLLLRSSTLPPFFSSPSIKLINRNFFSGDDAGTEISAYERALKFKRPSTIKWRQKLNNSVSLIGTVVRPVQKLNTKSEEIGAYTVLRTKSSSKSNYLWVLLKMWGKMAEICTDHLKNDDTIYVSGHLGSYSKADRNGTSKTNYVVTVKEINYVQLHIQVPACESAKPSRTEDSGETSFDKYTNRLHLWQIFFSNPYEWFDCRNSKKSPNSPDFRHKSTGEVLWLRADDPPWVRKQLRLQDSRLVRGLETGVSSDSHLTPLVYDDLF